MPEQFKSDSSASLPVLIPYDWPLTHYDLRKGGRWGSWWTFVETPHTKLS